MQRETGPNMNATAQKMFEDALRLPEADRADLAASLIESLDETKEQDVDSAWAAEIRRRIEDLDSGRVKPMSWDAARRVIVGESDGPNS
jgi:putative addiction module component (TIGR02574 family)